MYKLPVWNTIGDAYRFIWAERSAWLNYAAFPFVAIGLLATIFLLTVQSSIGLDIFGIGVPLTPDQTAQLERQKLVNLASAAWIVSLFIIIFYYLVYITFAVAWHRRYLLGPEKTSAREVFVWHRRHWRFLGRTVFLAVLLIIFGTLIGLASAALLAVVLSSGIANLPVLGFAIGFVVAMLPGLLLSLLACSVAAAFPAAAIEDNEIGFSSAGELAKGNVWRIWFTFLVGLFVPLTVVQFVLDWLFLTAFPPESWLSSIGLTALAMVTLQAANFVGVALGVSMLSIIYRRLRDNVPLGSESPSA